MAEHKHKQTGVICLSVKVDKGKGGVAGRPCVFPFILGRVKHHSCTTDRDPDGLPWCSTKTDSAGV